jgi:hypothetical protein
VGLWHPPKPSYPPALKSKTTGEELDTKTDEEIKARREALRRERATKDLQRKIAAGWTKGRESARKARIENSRLEIIKRRKAAKLQATPEPILPVIVIIDDKPKPAEFTASKGIFPGHPLHGQYVKWLGDRKPSRSKAKEFVAIVNGKMPKHKENNDAVQTDN